MLRKKMNIAADKYPQTNTVKILHESFFSFKMSFFFLSCHVNHALIFIHSSFFNRLQIVIDFVDFTPSCINRLTPGDNKKSYAVNKSATFFLRAFNFYLQVFIYHLFVPPGIKGLNVIYMWLFQRGHFQKLLVLHIFSYSVS